MLPLSVLCDAGTHCPTCRDAGPDGERWRAYALPYYDVLAGWPCPKGYEWGSSPLPPSAALVVPAPLPWPLTIRLIARWRADGDAGVGDTAKRGTGKAGDLFEKLVKRIGLDCGCPARRARWNALYPYPPPA